MVMPVYSDKPFPCFFQNAFYFLKNKTQQLDSFSFFVCNLASGYPSYPAHETKISLNFLTVSRCSGQLYWTPLDTLAVHRDCHEVLEVNNI